MAKFRLLTALAPIERLAFVISSTLVTLYMVLDISTAWTTIPPIPTLTQWVAPRSLFIIVTLQFRPSHPRQTHRVITSIIIIRTPNRQGRLVTIGRPLADIGRTTLEFPLAWQIQQVITRAVIQPTTKANRALPALHRVPNRVGTIF